MRPPSLLAGIVLTFGAVALANLYLPADGAMPSSRPPASQPADEFAPPLNPAEPTAPDLSDAETQPEGLAEPFDEPAEGSEQAALAEPPEEREEQIAAADAAASPSRSGETPGRSAEPSEPPQAENTSARAAARAQPDVQQEGNRAAARQPERERAGTPREAAQAQPSARERIASAAQRRPAPTTQEPSSRSSTTNTAAPAGRFATDPAYPATNAAGAQHDGISVSAILGERAWVRVSDTQTLMVIAGDHVPGLGTVQAVDGDRVVFENGSTLEVSQ